MGELREVLHPHVAIVNFAQKRLEVLDDIDDFGQIAGVNGPGKFQRITQPLGGDAHGMMLLVLFRVGKPRRLVKQLLDALANNLLRLAADMLAGNERRIPSLFHGRTDGLLHHLQHAVGLELIDGFENARLDPLPLALDVIQQTGNSRHQDTIGNRGQARRQEFDQHVMIPGFTQIPGQLANLLVPRLDLLPLPAGAEHIQCGTQPPRGNTRAVNRFNVFTQTNTA